MTTAVEDVELGHEGQKHYTVVPATRDSGMVTAVQRFEMAERT